MTEFISQPAINFINRSLERLNRAELEMLGADIDAWLELPDIPVADFHVLDGTNPRFHWDPDFGQWVFAIDIAGAEPSESDTAPVKPGSADPERGDYAIIRIDNPEPPHGSAGDEFKAVYAAARYSDPDEWCYVTEESMDPMDAGEDGVHAYYIGNEDVTVVRYLPKENA